MGVSAACKMVNLLDLVVEQQVDRGEAVQEVLGVQEHLQKRIVAQESLSLEDISYLLLGKKSHKALSINLRLAIEKSLGRLSRKLQMAEVQSLLRLGEHLVRQESRVGLEVGGEIRNSLRQLIAAHTKYFSEKELERVLPLYY